MILWLAHMYRRHRTAPSPPLPSPQFDDFFTSTFCPQLWSFSFSVSRQSSRRSSLSFWSDQLVQTTIIRSVKRWQRWFYLIHSHSEFILYSMIRKHADILRPYSVRRTTYDVYTQRYPVYMESLHSCAKVEMWVLFKCNISISPFNMVIMMLPLEMYGNQQKPAKEWKFKRKLNLK